MVLGPDAVVFDRKWLLELTRARGQVKFPVTSNVLGGKLAIKRNGDGLEVVLCSQDPRKSSIKADNQPNTTEVGGKPAPTIFQSNTVCKG